MKREVYEQCVEMVVRMMRESPLWADYAQASFEDYISGDLYDQKRAFVALGEKVYRELLSYLATEDAPLPVISSSIVQKIYDDRYHMNYSAYHFVIKVMAGALSADTDVPLESIGEKFFHAGFETVDEELPLDARALRKYRDRLVATTRSNQLIHFTKPEKSSIEIAYPSVPVLMELLKSREKIFIENWESLGFTRISECSECGKQFFKPYKRLDTAHSTECPVCDAGKRTKRGKPIAEAPYDIDGTPLVLVCDNCSHEQRVKASADAPLACENCGEELKFPSYPIFEGKKIRSKLSDFCVAARSDTVAQSAARNLLRRAKELKLNFGLHPLYLALCFLKWKDAQGEEYNSPLLLMKLDLFLEKTKGKYYISLDKTEDGCVFVNHALQKKLGHYSKDLSLLLPRFVDGMEYFDYKMAVESALGGFPCTADWKVEDKAAIGIFNYQRMQLETDINASFDKYLAHPIVRLLGRFDEEPKPLEAKAGGDTNFLVLDADNSQSEVINAAASGRSFVLQGPPGTGKSQTISNIIAGAMAHGKTVLFVTEKASARNIIWDNLSAVHLDGAHRLTDFVYHSEMIGTVGTGSKKKDSSGQKTGPSKTAFRNFYNEKFAERLSPIKHATEQFSHSHVEGKIKDLYGCLDTRVAGYTLGELIGVWSQYADEEDLPFFGDIKFSIDELQELEDRLSHYYRFAEKFGIPYTHHPLYGYEENDPAIPSVQSMEAAISARNALSALRDGFLKTSGVALSPSYDLLAGQLEEIKRWEIFPQEIFAWLRTTSEVHTVDELRALLTKKKKYAQKRKKACLAAKPQCEGRDCYVRLVKPEFYDTRYGDLRMSFGAFKNPFLRIGKRYAQEKERVLSSWMLEASRRSFKEISDLLDVCVKNQPAYYACLQFEADFEKDRAELFGLSRDWETDWDSILRLLDNAIKAIGAQSSDISDALMAHVRHARSYQTVSESLPIFAKEAMEKRELMLRCVGDAAKAFEAHVFDINSASYEEIFGKFEEVLSYRSDLTEWIDFQAFLKGLGGEKLLLSVLANLQDARVTEKERAVRMLRKAYYRRIISSVVYRDSSPVRQFERNTHQKMLELYQRIDRDKMHSDALFAYNSLLERKNAACAQVKGNSKLISTRTNISVKQMIREHWDTIRAITPCFMMSPLSVSQYIDIDINFDLVIFDEASQIFLEDSLASLARGSQVIISGDRQQLPPSDFFRSNDLDEEDYEGEEEGIGRSVLDAAGNSDIDEISLKWHYRSRDESLISFSNANFYGNSLVTFPAATQNPELRLIYHYVADGEYLSGGKNTNPKEADEVVRLIWEEMNSPERRHLSLGVVAFSKAQASEIEERWLDFVAASPERRRFVQEWENMESHSKDPLIFCNLDTIQGDERDTMIISTTYGKSPKGDFNLLYLGPVRTESGGKRLNVAVTRAKARMLIVSSMTAGFLQQQLAKSAGKCNEGAELLCEFLRYAEEYEVGGRAYAACDRSCLIQSLCAILDECGVSYDVGVGMSSCKVDIGVKASDDPNRYVLGIVTDEQGLRSQTVREYARLRPQVLTKRYGWELYNVWLASWFLNYEKEKEQLIEAVRRVTAPTP